MVIFEATLLFRNNQFPFFIGILCNLIDVRKNCCVFVVAFWFYFFHQDWELKYITICWTIIHAARYFPCLPAVHLARF